MADAVNPSGADPTGTAYSNITSANYKLTSPYAADTLAKGVAAANTPYQAFKIPEGVNPASARVAGIDPTESKAYEGIASMDWQHPTQEGVDLTKQSAGEFGLPAAQQYMNPYMQQVVDQQKKSAMQDYARQQPQQTSNAFQAGAGRGTRSALLEAEGQRNLQGQLQDIQAKGSQAAYENAQTQYNADMARKMQAAQQLFNQGTDIYGKQVGAGQAKQLNKQQHLSAMYEDFLKEQGYPKEQVGYMMQLINQMPQYQDYASKAYQTAAPVDTQTATAGGIEAILNSILGGGK